MPLDTQSFGISRHWLTTALRHVPDAPDVFGKKQMCLARKLFLAGSNQLPSIKNWLARAGVIEIVGRQVKLTEIGQLMAAQDARAESAWTWWLFHVHLCTHPDAFPYSTFFRVYDHGMRWKSIATITEELTAHAREQNIVLAEDSISTYFGGVAQTFQVGGFANELGLLEERTIGDGRTTRKVRRRLTKAEDILVAYGAVLLQLQHFHGQATVEAREILGKGFAGVLGLRETDVRESLSRITTHKEYGRFVQYRRQVNQDSVQFLRSDAADAALRELRLTGYRSQAVGWQ